MGGVEEKPVGLARVPEAVLTYEQVILSQINHCTKLSGLIVTSLHEVTYRDLDVTYCVRALQSMLPFQLRVKLEDKLEWFKQWVLERASRYECFKKNTCGNNYEEYNKMYDEIYSEARQQFRGYRHVVDGMVAYYTWPYEKHTAWTIIRFNLFKLTLIVDLLAEEGIIGFKQPTLFVGGVKSVPERSNQGGL